MYALLNTIIIKACKKTSGNSRIQFDVFLTCNDVTDQRPVRFLSFPHAGMGMLLSHMDENIRNFDLVCEKKYLSYLICTLMQK